MTHHALTIHNRGAHHRHPWLPQCACGWSGVPRRRRHGAEAEYTAHVHQQQRTIASNVMPRPLTPSDRLPEVLR